MIKAWSLQKWSLQLFAISIIVRIYIYMHVYLLFAHAGNEIDTIQWQNLNKIKMIYMNLIWKYMTKPKAQLHLEYTSFTILGNAIDKREKNEESFIYQ